MPVGTRALTVRIDGELLKRLRHLSIDRGESLQKMVTRLLEEFVARETRAPSHRKGGKTRR